MAAVAKVFSEIASGDDHMIFVTVGSAAPFDALIREIDELAAGGLFGQPVLFQIGKSKYIPMHGEWFRLRKNIDDIYDKASFIFCHGGMTVGDCLIKRKKFVAFPNKNVADNHQEYFLAEIARVCDISWSVNIADAEKLYRERTAKGAAVCLMATPRVWEML
jgi:UDP-N-acetylglucosamine transferase subunit ALG13